jgi:hypothetical protein
MRRPLLSLLSALLLSAAGCGEAPPPVVDRGDPLDPRRLYPLADGNIWTYDIDTGTGVNTAGIFRARRVADNRYEMRPDGGEAVVYEVRPDGIWNASGPGAWLLHRPIRVGSEWETVNGRNARVTSVSESISTPMAGNFEGCVVVEETGGAANRPQITTYCPDVGAVRIEARQQMQLSGQEVAAIGTLRAYLFPEE